MKTKIVYVSVSSDKDIYLEQAGDMGTGSCFRIFKG